MTDRPATVTLAAEIGGPDASRATRQAHSELRRLLRRYCSGPYSPEISEFAPILRIDGSITRYSPGLKFLRRNRKKRYITVDIGIPSKEWDGRTQRHLREYLVKMVREALLALTKRLLDDKTIVNGDALMHDYEKVVHEYLKPD